MTTGTAGTYTITYSVSDSAGNAATQVTRTVTVADAGAPVISLIGDAAVTHALGTDYTDAGATATDNVDGDITSSITTSGTVTTGTAGTYTITYSVSDSAGNAATQVTRTVTVADAGAPVISLIGDAAVTHALGTDYTDAGATATDNVDGDITSSITTSGTVTTGTAGTYTITYSVSDSAGNAATQVTRTVTVEGDATDTDGDGTPDSADADDDGDGVADSADAFPLISLDGRIDTDGDGFPNECDDRCLTAGMLADQDDDNDGVTDVDDAFPLDASRSSDESSDSFSFDVDKNLEAQPLTDGLLVIRHLFGFSGESLTSGAVSGEANRDDSDSIASYLTDADSELDIDGDGESKPLTDGLLLIRYLFGFSGDSLISGAIGDGAERDTADEVEAYIEERVPVQ